MDKELKLRRFITIHVSYMSTYNKTPLQAASGQCRFGNYPIFSIAVITKKDYCSHYLLKAVSFPPFNSRVEYFRSSFRCKQFQTWPIFYIKSGRHSCSKSLPIINDWVLIPARNKYYTQKADSLTAIANSQNRSQFKKHSYHSSPLYRYSFGCDTHRLVKFCYWFFVLSHRLKKKELNLIEGHRARAEGMIFLGFFTPTASQ